MVQNFKNQILKSVQTNLHMNSVSKPSICWRDVSNLRLKSGPGLDWFYDVVKLWHDIYRLEIPQ